MTINRMAIEAFEAEIAKRLGLVRGPEAAKLPPSGPLSGFYGDPAPMPDLVEFVKRRGRDLRTTRERLLLDLANVSLDSRRLQKRMESFEHEKADVIASAQKALQEGVWSRDVLLAAKQQLVDYLLVAATSRPDRGGALGMLISQAGLCAPLGVGHLEFSEKNFLGQLVIAILENWWRMAKCGNPDCPAPYFLAKRSTQRYCERGDCTQYAVRQKALKWWTENRSKASRSKSPKGRNRALPKPGVAKPPPALAQRSTPRK